MPSIAEVSVLSQPASSAVPLAPALKRKRAEEKEPDNRPKTPVKRQKVAFNPEVNVHVLQDANEKPLALVQEEVRRAIERHRTGDSIEYDGLKSLLKLKPTSENALSNSLLRKYILVLSGLVHAMGNNCGGLVDALINCHWLRRDEQFLADFQRLLTTLLSAHSGYIPHVLRWCVQQFSNRKLLTCFYQLPLTLQKVPNSRNPTPLLPEVPLQEVLNRLHRTIEHVVEFVPSTLSTLENVVTKNFPFHLAKSSVHISYVTNLLRLMGYCRPLETSILQLIVENLVTVDVQVGIDIDDLDDEDMERLMAELARHDPSQIGDDNEIGQDDDADDGGGDEYDSDADPEKALNVMKDSMLKLDAMILLLFQHYDKELANGSEESNRRTFEQLISIFARSILTTHNSRHTQYILFRFSQLYPDLHSRFTTALAKIAFDRNRPIAIRVSAVSYLASFAARGAKVDRDGVRAIFALISEEMEKLRKGYTSAGYGPDPDRYRFYYSMFQACMYIFCFRWRDFLLDQEDVDPILDDTEEMKWAPGIKDAFNRHIYCTVNPLKVCAPLIVEMFAKVTKALNFLYLYSIIETNKRVRLSRSALASTIRETTLSLQFSESSLQLEAHYAFEPYLLPSSKEWVEELYLDFSSLAPPGMEEDDSSEEEDINESEDELDEDTATEEEK